MITLAIDPSTTRTGIARLDGHTLIEAISIRGVPTVDQIRGYMAGVDRVAVEDQFIGDDEDGTPQEVRAKKQSALSTKGAAVRWLTVAEMLGIPTVSLHPSTWRSRLKIRRGPKAYQKRQAVAVCVKRGWIIPNHDAAEAACIGLVACLTRTQGK